VEKKYITRTEMINAVCEDAEDVAELNRAQTVGLHFTNSHYKLKANIFMPGR
jgi:hypothetical protein